MWLNICHPLFFTLCGTDVAGCQEWGTDDPNGHASLGRASSMSFNSLRKKKNKIEIQVLIFLSSQRKFDIDGFICEVFRRRWRTTNAD